MKVIRSWLSPNPILVKELRSRMRGPRAFITLTAALVIMSGLMIALTSLLSRAGNTFGGMLSPQIGQVLFECLINFELLLVCTVTPALTSGAISTEREKLTFEMLLATPLGPARILWGKLISALSYVFVLIFAAIPLGSLVFLFGGVAPLTMLKALFILVVVAITQGIYGLFLSALLGRTGRATLASFLSVMGLMFGPLVLLVANGIFYNSRIIVPRFFLSFSPVSMLVSAVESVGSVNNGSVSGLFGFIAGQWDPSLNPIALTQFPRPIYHYSLAICGVLAIVLFTLTIGLVNPARRFYLARRTALIGGGILLVFVGVMGAAFLLTAPHYEWIQAPAAADQTNFQRQVGVMPPAPAIAVAQAYPAPTAMPAPTATLVPTPVPGFVPAIVQPGEASGPAPKVTPTVITAQGALMPLADQVAIYAAAARQVYLKDSTTGDKNPHFPVIYLVAKTNDRTGSPNQPDAGPALLSSDLQTGIGAALSDLPGRVVWVIGLEAVTLVPQTGAVEDGGLVVTFGNIQLQPDGSVQLPASAYVASLIGGGQTYTLAKDGSIWKITGTTGSTWIQ